MNESINGYNKYAPNLNSALISRIFSPIHWMFAFMSFTFLKITGKTKQNRVCCPTWWQSSGAGSPLWVSAFLHAAELSPAASCWCTQPSSAAWWLYWSVPGDKGTPCQWPWLCSHRRGSSVYAAAHLHTTFMLGWELSVATRLCKVSNPSLILKRRFCSAEMWVILLVSVCCRQQQQNTQTCMLNLICRGRAWRHRWNNTSYLICFHFRMSRETCRRELRGGRLICQVWWWRLAWMSWKTN